MITIRHHEDAVSIQMVASGHSQMAEKGQDIVCAGVSALTHAFGSAVARLSDEGKIAIGIYQQTDEADHIFATAPVNTVLREVFLAVIETFRDMAKQYPDNIQVVEY